MLEPVRKKVNGKIKSYVWWLRKKVPTKYRALVGTGEVWRSLNTTDRKTAGTRCAVLSANLEADWASRLAAQTDGSNPGRDNRKYNLHSKLSFCFRFDDEEYWWLARSRVPEKVNRRLSEGQA